MKIFTAIFSVYLLALAVMPCSDKEDCMYMGSEQTSSPTDHSDHEQDAEHCTPFCICACCGQTFSTNFTSYELPFENPVTSQVFPVYTSPFISEVYFNIWQPPKLS